MARGRFDPDQGPRLLLRYGAFERDAARDRWRFGTRRIANVVVDRLIAAGHAVRQGDRVVRAPGATAR
jgi:hypothetical protein